MRMTDNLPGILYVRTFGGFSVTYNGKIIAGGSKASDSQMDNLLMILLHHRQTGAARDRIEEILFGDREISNVHHALQSVIYNTKKKLGRMGIPDADTCIRQEKSIFYWSSSVPVIEDSEEFIKIFGEAYETDDTDERLALLSEAVHWYSGEFLPVQTAVT